MPPSGIRTRISNRLRTLIDRVKYGQNPMFRTVSIETSSYCNRTCGTCPVSQHPRGKKYLSEELYVKIVGELARIRYAGEVYLHGYNEPLCDSSLPDKVRLARKLLPRARILFFSNGDYLTLALLRELVSSGLDELRVMMYDGKIHAHIEAILGQASDRERSVLQVHVTSGFIGNRGGNLEQVVAPGPLLADCYLPSQQLAIYYDGTVPVCCNDYHGAVAMGNVEETPIMEIWNNEGFRAVRSMLKQRQRDRISVCKGCNFLGAAHDFRYLTAEEMRAFNSKVVAKSGVGT